MDGHLIAPKALQDFLLAVPQIWDHLFLQTTKRLSHKQTDSITLQLMSLSQSSTMSKEKVCLTYEPKTVGGIPCDQQVEYWVTGIKKSCDFTDRKKI